MIGRKEADLAGEHRGAERDRKAVAVGAEIQYMAALRQSVGNAAHLGEETRRTYAVPAAPGDDLFGGCSGNDGRGRHGGVVIS
jgi:hypothetical protein